MKVVQPPKRWDGKANEITVFLGGSIEMGKAIDWQKTLITLLTDIDNDNAIEQHIVAYNPRRDDWDSSWSQSIDHPEFVQQVNWELDQIEDADFVVIYLDPDTKSPITLLELGMLIGRAKDQDELLERLVVCCPDGYWRKGNVDVMCHRYHINQVNDLMAVAEVIRDYAYGKQK